MTIDLKLLILIIIATLSLIVWLTWWLSRSRSPFDADSLAVWNTAPLGVMLLSRGGQFLYANKKVTELLRMHSQISLDKETHLQRLVRVPKSKVNNGQALNADNADIATTPVFKRLLQQFQPEARVQQFSLNVTAETRIDVWSGIFGQTRLILLRDLSEQRQREQEVQLFWGGISHEMRTPLTSILAHLEVARSEPASEEIRQHSLDIVYGQAQRLNKLIQNALELGQLKAAVGLEITAVDIILIAEEAIADLILLAESQDIHLSLTFDSPLPHVLGNWDRLKQVFINLLDNGLKYGAAGDEITVSLRAKGSHVECRVADTGDGIPLEHLSRLTEQFYRARRDAIGSGLGLTIVEEIIRQHHGQLTISSRTDGPQTGTRIAFTLPVAPPDTGRTA